MTDQRADKQHTGIDNTVDTSKVLKNKEDTPARACYTPIDPKPASPQIGDGKNEAEETVSEEAMSTSTGLASEGNSEAATVDQGSPENQAEENSDENTEEKSPPATSSKKSKMERALEIIRQKYRFAITDDSKAYVIDDSGPNPQAFCIGTRQFNSAVRQLAHATDRTLILTHDDLSALSSHLEAVADLEGERAPVWLQVADTDSGIEIDIGDSSLARIAISPGEVKILKTGSTTLFHRSPSSRPFTLPAGKGDIAKLMHYVNLDTDDAWLLVGWIGYTLACSKVSSSNYVILVLQGERGTGKTTLCEVVIGALVGPNSLGVQAFPGSQKDLAIAVQNAHVSMFDNIRVFTSTQADMLCRTSSGTTVNSRMLFTDGVQYSIRLHGGVILNGIHSFVNQDDLAQRCLTLHLKPIDPSKRSTEAQLRDRFQKDLPVIFKGLLDLIAAIMQHLPTVNAKYPERMLEFVHWLAAMEKALGKPEGELQLAYRKNLVGAMQDNLQDDLLASTLVQFAKQKSWGGTPTDLLTELGQLAGPQVVQMRQWPGCAISLSLRLDKLKSKLSGAGVEVNRGKKGRKRHIDIEYTGRSS